MVAIYRDLSIFKYTLYGYKKSDSRNRVIFEYFRYKVAMVTLQMYYS